MLLLEIDITNCIKISYSHISPSFLCTSLTTARTTRWWQFVVLTSTNTQNKSHARSYSFLLRESTFLILSRHIAASPIARKVLVLEGESIVKLKALFLQLSWSAVYGTYLCRMPINGLYTKYDTVPIAATASKGFSKIKHLICSNNPSRSHQGLTNCIAMRFVSSFAIAS